MEGSLKSLTNEAKSVLILLPENPNFDEAAAGLSLYLSLRSEKGVQISCPSPMVVEFNRLIGVNKITQELGNKNLLIEFSDYKATDVERVSWDIIDGKFRLTVIPKPEMPAPGKDQVEIKYSGISADLILLIGGLNESQFPALSSKDVAGAKVVHIGVRELASSTKDFVSLSRPSSSVSEVVSYLIAENAYPMDADMATNLLSGIEEATGNYSSENVGPSTLEIAAQLMRAGGKRSAGKSQVSPQQYPVGAIPGQVIKPQPQTQQVQDQTIHTIQPQQQVKPVDLSAGTSQPSQTLADSGRNGDQDIEEPPTDWLKPKIYKGTSVS